MALAAPAKPLEAPGRWQWRDRRPWSLTAPSWDARRRRRARRIPFRPDATRPACRTGSEPAPAPSRKWSVRPHPAPCPPRPAALRPCSVRRARSPAGRFRSASPRGCPRPDQGRRCCHRACRPWRRGRSRPGPRPGRRRGARQPASGWPHPDRAGAPNRRLAGRRVVPASRRGRRCGPARHPGCPRSDFADPADRPRHWSPTPPSRSWGHDEPVRRRTARQGLPTWSGPTPRR